MLRFNQQTYRQDRELFRIEQLELAYGQLVVLFGANGTGKSTWLKSIVAPKETGNHYTIDGQSTEQLGALEMAKRVAFVDNHFMGFDHLRVSEYIALGRYPYTGISGRLSAEDRAIVQRVSEQLNITHLLHKSTAELSDGERQRCGIAKALVQETPVILLDEPTSFLDYPSKQYLFDLLRETCKCENKLMIVSTHDLELGLEYGTLWCIINPKQEFVVKTERLNKEELLKVSF